jgi:hypothetical protein
VDNITDVGDITAEQRGALERAIAAEASKPLTVAIMGQTGVGKSSLLNALFGTHLLVGDVRPTTKEPEAVAVRGSSGQPILFWDMPGIGESESADRGYMLMYGQKLIECDVVLWAIHADSRSTTFDSAALSSLLGRLPESERRAVATKLTFVLTKADILVPPPWIYVRDGETGSFAPSKKTQQLLDEKASYYQDQLLLPHGSLSSTETFNDAGFSLPDPRFSGDEYHIRYEGYMSEEACARYTRQYPQFAAVFERLSENHRIIPCSALYRYNLVRLMVCIVNKLGEDAIARFKRFADSPEALDTVPVSVMRKYGNLVVWDKRKGRLSFDLDDVLS